MTSTAGFFVEGYTMKRKTIPLFGVGLQGKSAVVTAQKRQNCYYEIQKENDRTKIAIYGTPGLELFVDFGDTPVRGKHPFIGNSNLYVVHRGTFWEVNNAGVKTSRGTINTTSGRVSLADNGTQIMLVDGTDGWIFNTSSLAFTKITDVDFPSSPQTVTFNNSRFIVNKGNTGQFYGSSSYDGLTWLGTDFATAESSPDNLVRVESSYGDVILFGEYTTEIWGDTGSSGFPYARISGAQFEWGLAARWSLTRFIDTFAFLGRNRIGEVGVFVLEGYKATKISDLELDHIINNYASVADATAFGYMLGGHPMYQINFPSAGYSWLYDASSGVWTSIKSYGLTRHRAEIHSNFINQNIVSDYTNGRLYKIKSSAYTDNGDSIELELISKHVFESDMMLRLDSIQIDMETGVGLATGQGSNPLIMLQISKDGGRTFGNEIWVSFGEIGEYLSRAIYRRGGRGRDFVFKLKITDPVKRVITGANAVFSMGSS